MDTRQCFERLAAMGVRVESMTCESGYLCLSVFDRGGVWDTCALSEEHAAALMCDMVMQRHPYWTVHLDPHSGLWFVYDHSEDGKIFSGGPTRLAALVLANERFTKWNAAMERAKEKV